VNSGSKTAIAREVLLADDDPSNLELATEVLNRFGCHVTAVADGASALDAAQREHFDIIFLDVHMPEMSGLDATIRIREAERQSGGHVPIVALTASALLEEQQSCLDAGMDAVLIKPYRFERLQELLITLCG